jgi:hypothetical protein
MGRQKSRSRPEVARRHAPRKSAAHGWRSRRLLYGAIGQHRVVSIAAGVTFFALLAMFPAVAALVSIYGIFADPGTILVYLDDLSSVLPSGAIEVIGDQLTRVVACLHGLCASGAACGHCRNRRAARRAGICRTSIARRNDGHGRAMAGPLCHRGSGPRHRLPLRAGSRSRAVVMDHVGQRIGRGALDRRVDPLLVVCRKFRRIQQDLRIARRRRRFMTWMWISCMVILAGAEVDAVMERLDRSTAN